MNESGEAPLISEQKPEVESGAFTINFLSTDPKGFEVESRHSLRRRDLDDKGQPLTPLPLTQEQKDLLRKNMASEVLFSLPKDFPPDKKEAVRRIFDLNSQIVMLKRQIVESGEREDPLTDDEVESLLIKLEGYLNAIDLKAEQRDSVRVLLKEQNLQDRIGLKVGVRNVQKLGVRNLERDGNVLRFDTRPVSYPIYSVASSPTDSIETLDLGAITGAAGILLTADNKFILQHRSPKNNAYGDIPGASFAGLVDGEFEREYEEDGVTVKSRTGTLKKVDTQYIKNTGFTEAFQEIGLSADDFSEFRIVGEARDHVREHDEFLLTAKSKLTAIQIAQRAADAPRSRAKTKLNEDGEFHFDENFITIDADPKTIEILLTEVKCPLPPTHAAAFIAAGYNLILEKPVKEGGGLTAATIWKDRIELKTKQNYVDIDKKVKAFYENSPDMLTDVQPGKPKRNPNGYEPFYTPTEQGLKSFRFEMERNHLLAA